MAARRSCWYGGRNYGAGQGHEGGTAAASCETWRHYGAAGTEDGTTELDSDTRVVLQAVSQLPEVLGRSGYAHWIGIRLKWFRCQETVRVRIFDGESWVPNMLAKKYSLQFRNKLYYITATIIHLRNNI